VSRRRPGKALTEVDLLELAPVRCATWVEREGQVVITRPRVRVRRIGDLLALFESWLRPKVLRLDPIGSSVWRRLDGRSTVGELVRELRGSIDAAEEGLEQRLGLFIRTLRAEGLVGFPEWDQVSDDLETD